jgi:hypothetical protein
MYDGMETFERGDALARIETALPAITYNLTRILLAESERDCVFVPIRPMQYMAVIDREEIIFVDSQYKRWIEVAWRGFHPGDRASLDRPVAYQAVYYTPEGAELQRRLQAEFHQALRLLHARRPVAGSAAVLAFDKPAAID